MTNCQAAVDSMAAQGVSQDVATTVLSFIAEGQSVMLATLKMFGVIAVCLCMAAAIIWLVPKPKGPIDTSGAH